MHLRRDETIIQGTTMIARLLKILSVIVTIGIAAGCKVAVVVPSSGDVASATGSRNCAGGTLCEFNVKDRTFSESFTAVARPGYKFSRWKAGPGFLCGNSRNSTCVVTNTMATEEYEGVFDAVIAGGSVFYAMPIFEYVGHTADATVSVGPDGFLIIPAAMWPDTRPHPVGNSGRHAKATVGSRQRLGVFGRAVTRARYPVEAPELPDSTARMASISEP
jgi:hypothetical protein